MISLNSVVECAKKKKQTKLFYLPGSDHLLSSESSFLDL